VFLEGPCIRPRQKCLKQSYSLNHNEICILSVHCVQCSEQLTVVEKYMKLNFSVILSEGFSGPTRSKIKMNVVPYRVNLKCIFFIEMR
jgi:hypothetical protein